MQVGRYDELVKLGGGGMGVVYRARDTVLGRTVAIKRIRLDSLESSSPEDRQRVRELLYREARAAAMLDHPGIITVYDVVEMGEYAYIVMAFVNGGTLTNRLKPGQPAPRELTLRVLKECASALDHAHRKGVVHRDIKPDNVMISDDGPVKLADFGIAKWIGSETITRRGELMGTPAYMAPERIRSDSVDGRADQYSLAVMAYMLLTGQLPFQAGSEIALAHKIVYGDHPPARQLDASLPEEVDVVLSRALAKIPSDRYSSCTEFVSALERALQAALPPRHDTPSVRVNPRDGLGYVWIPPGTFEMGATPVSADVLYEGPPHRVTLTRGFWISQTPVTVAAFLRFAHKNRHWALAEMKEIRLEQYYSPVVNLPWQAAFDYCRWAGGRLATEAEWEYVVRLWRAGLGEDLRNLEGGRFDRPQSRGSSPDETTGLLDLWDVVGEWCADWFQPGYYRESPSVDPPGPPTGTTRVVRRNLRLAASGRQFVRPSSRFQLSPLDRAGDLSFRCVLNSMP